MSRGPSPLDGERRASTPHRVWRFRVALAVLAILTTGVCRSRAQQTPEAPIVRDIEIRNVGKGRIDEGLVTSHTTHRVGKPFQRNAIARDMKALLDLGHFSTVNISAEPIDEGVKLIYTLAMKLKLQDPVTFDGMDYLSESKARKKLDLTPGDWIDDQTLGVSTRKLLEEYHKANYPYAEITWTFDDRGCPSGYTHVVVHVKEGGRAGIGEIIYVGNDHVPSSEFRAAMQLRSWYNPMRWFTREPYDPDQVEQGTLAIREVYRNRGYLDAEVSLAEPDTDAHGNLILTVVIKEGPRYRLGDMSITGVTLFPLGELYGCLTGRAGDLASAATIKDSAMGVRDYYGRRGYIETIVRPILDPDPARAIVNVRFDVHEGTLTHIRNITIRGNTRTRDKVVRRELLVYPGDTYNEVRIRDSERIISNLGFFSDVHSFPEPTDREDEKNLVLEVEEKRTGTFLVGAGFSSIDKLIGFVEVSQGNFDISGWPFTGAGQKLRLRGQFGTRRKNYELSFVEPWFLDRKLSLGVDLYRSEYNYSEFDVRRTGSAIRLGHALPSALPGANRLTLQYRIEQVVVDDLDTTLDYVDIENGDPVLFEPEDAIKSELTLTVMHDTRNNPFIPTAGSRASISGNVAGGPLGFDTKLYGMGLRAKRYFPLWFGHVFSVFGQYQTVDSLGGDEDLPLAERLFIGGGRTLRGFDYRDVGPKARPEPDNGTHRPYGGRSLGMLSLEYTLPIVQSIRFAGFYDIGNVWRDAFGFDASNLASSAGVGIRFDLPGFPIRIDRAWVIDKDNEATDEDTWVFWIGYDQ